MGIEGISPNQLRLEPNNQNMIPQNVQIQKRIDGLATSKKINPDEENEQGFEENKGKNGEKKQEENLEEIINYDLSDTKKYELKVEENTNNILIIDKDTDEVLQVFSAKILSNLTGFLNTSNGILVNRKF